MQHQTTSLINPRWFGPDCMLLAALHVQEPVANIEQYHQLQSCSWCSEHLLPHHQVADPLDEPILPSCRGHGPCILDYPLYRVSSLSSWV